MPALQANTKRISSFLRRGLLALALLFPLALSGCSKEPTSAGKQTSAADKSSPYGGTIVLSTVSDPKSFNPILAKETSSTGILNFLFEGLTGTDAETLEVESALASRWSEGAGGREWLFHLREDARWSDGKPLTADDVIFTFNDLIFNEAVPNSLRDIFTVEGKRVAVEKIDEHTVKFALPTAFAPFLRTMSAPILPKHILEDSVKKGTFNATWGVNTPPDQIVGNGPFVLAQYVSGQRVLLKRNPYYWKKDAQGRALPYLDEVLLLIVPNQDVSFLKFQEGELDFYDVRGADYPLLKPQEQKGNFTLYRSGPTFGSTFLMFNQNTGKDPQTGKPYLAPHKLGWFTNKQFRKAAAHAIDKQAIIDIVYNGLAVPQDSSMSPSEGYYYTPDVMGYKFDLNKGKELLAREGFKDLNADGVLEDAQGHSVDFTLLTNAGVTERVKMAEIIRKDLENLGMKVSLVQVEFNHLVSKLGQGNDWEAVVLGLTGGIEPHFGNNVWQSRGHMHLWNPRQQEPATEWEARIDRIFDMGVQELDKAKRKALYDEWQRIVSDELPFIYTVLPESIIAVRNKFENVRPTPYGGALHNVEEIKLKK